VVSDPKTQPSASELAAGMQSGVVAPTVEDNTPARGVTRASDSPMCMQCGVQMVRAGSCHACPSCGNTSGCSGTSGDDCQKAFLWRVLRCRSQREVFERAQCVARLELVEAPTPNGCAPPWGRVDDRS
jgi:hypothetical protein